MSESDFMNLFQNNATLPKYFEVRTSEGPEFEFMNGLYSPSWGYSPLDGAEGYKIGTSRIGGVFVGTKPHAAPFGNYSYQSPDAEEFKKNIEHFLNLRIPGRAPIQRLPAGVVFGQALPGFMGGRRSTRKTQTRRKHRKQRNQRKTKSRYSKRV